MQYIKSAIGTKMLITKANNVILNSKIRDLTKQNIMLLVDNNNKEHEIDLKSFTDESVIQILQTYPSSKMFVITDIVTMNTNGQEITYFLYKGYCNNVEKGFVFFQPVNKDTLEPIGKLLFSNLEDNIFYTTDAPKGEESSCNAIETQNNKPECPEIAFLIGHMDETRLIYDIERLIIDTVNNVSKHKNLKFNFIIRISVFGDKPSNNLSEKIESFDKITKKLVEPEYPNAKFTFELEF